MTSTVTSTRSGVVPERPDLGPDVLPLPAGPMLRWQRHTRGKDE